jgi:hypothetical protein
MLDDAGCSTELMFDSIKISASIEWNARSSTVVRAHQHRCSARSGASRDDFAVTADGFPYYIHKKSGKKPFYCFNKKIIGSELRHYVRDDSTMKLALSIP